MLVPASQSRREPIAFGVFNMSIISAEWSNPLCKEEKGERGKMGKGFSACILPDLV
jgi:hypothetical protein